MFALLETRHFKRCLLARLSFSYFLFLLSNLPDFAAFKHARVHNVGTHEGGLHPLHLLGQQLVGQRLVEAHRPKLAGAVILARENQQSL